MNDDLLYGPCRHCSRMAKVREGSDRPAVHTSTGEAAASKPYPHVAEPEDAQRVNMGNPVPTARKGWYGESPS